MQFLIYSIFRVFGLFVSLLPYRVLHWMGSGAGSLAFFFYRPFRKKALTNLAIAFGDAKTENERREIAKRSFQNLMITLLEFFRFKRSKGHLDEIVTLHDNPKVREVLERGQGIVFLSAHQANWEVPFLALTEKYRGVAIGRPIKNGRLYRYVLSVREMNGGKIVSPKNAIHQGLKALKRGDFLGIVGDQAYPESPYSYPLFGTRAWTASTPAILAYKTGVPLVVGTTKRENGRYQVFGSDPIWPNLSLPLKEEIPRMMDAAMHHLEESLKTLPEQWMWVHDRWKQQGIDHVKRKYRFGFILVVLPPNIEPFFSTISLLKKIYPRSFLTFFVSKGTPLQVADSEIWTYEKKSDLLVRDWRFQFVIDLYGVKKLKRHFLRLGAFKVISLDNIKNRGTIEESIKSELVKPECLSSLSFEVSSSDAEDLAPQTLGSSAKVNGQSPLTIRKSTRDPSKIPEAEEEKPQTQVNNIQTDLSDAS